VVWICLVHGWEEMDGENGQAWLDILGYATHTYRRTMAISDDQLTSNEAIIVARRQCGSDIILSW